MCLSKAYVDRNGKRELLMEEIAFIKVEDEKLLLRTIFGEQKEIGANISEIDFLARSIILKNLKQRGFTA